MEPINLKKSVKLILSETSTLEVLRLVEQALQAYNEQRNPLAIWNKVRKSMSSSNAIKKLEAFAKDLKENIQQGVISGEKPLDNSYQAELLHILYGLAISEASFPINPRGLSGEVRESIKFEDSPTYTALLDIRVLILGDVFTQCTEADNWASTWNYCREEPLNRTIKLMVDQLYDGNALLTEPQERIYYVYFSGKDILKSSIGVAQKSIDELKRNIRQWVADASNEVSISSSNPNAFRVGK
jgi:hypothetical protein